MREKDVSGNVHGKCCGPLTRRGVLLLIYVAKGPLLSERTLRDTPYRIYLFFHRIFLTRR